MKGQMIAAMVCVCINATAAALAFGATAGCPGDVTAAVQSACPCGTFRNHGQYMGCIRARAREFEKSGCDQAAIDKMTRCASTSTCGESKVVCCIQGHAETLPAKRCTSRGGTVASGAVSVCDASCSAAGAQNPPPSSESSTSKQGHERRGPHRKLPAGQEPYPSGQAPPAQTH